MKSSWKRAATLAGSDRRLLVESTALVLALSVGLRVLPFTALRRRLEWWSTRSTRRGFANAIELERVRWAVEVAGRRIPGTKCLCEALTGYAMLRRRGYDASLRIGVRAGAAMGLDAHAWVECGGTVVIGLTPALTEYAVLS